MISDFWSFESTRKSDHSFATLHEERITYEYFDPQIFIQSRFIPNIKSDIYSLGVILWQLTSGIRPFSKVPNRHSLAVDILNGKREKTVPGTPSGYAKLYETCWSAKPKKRPKLEKILHKLQQSREATEIIENHIS
ncbi:kinase-like domain-containing protein [Gigaspora rosea]|uniref:Kinase-like domain-containing protein n=1 Tax=Gigaspora rosea TaxID=44941 RepID=A0A397ULH4_9GLOM|nr:kinase-like domain-containing protein [Gigaspora rosea]CAG8549018.1 15840_t:CDS:1 [Gigaspora rosea]